MTSPQPLTATSSNRMIAELPGLARHAGPRKLIIRGDLTSTTGYGHETRALAKLLRKSFEILGVDLHHNPGDDASAFPGSQIKDQDIAAICARGEKPIVLNNTPPDTFAYFHNATNIGAFYWETDRLPLQKRWAENICAMDYMWAKTSFDRRLMQECGYLRPIATITWPFDFDKPTSPASPDGYDVSVYMVDRAGHSLEAERWSLGQIRRQADNLFLSVKSLAPRKGLPILLSEWRDYMRATASNDILLLKLRFIHNTSLSGGATDHILKTLALAGYTDGEPVRVAFTSEDLPNHHLSAMYKSADAYVTASYGEGFGGPLVEALLLHRPVIAGRHTGAADLLAADNPLIYATQAKYVGLRGNPDIYPSASTWHLPVQGALARAFRRFCDMSSSQRLDVTAEARTHAAAFCSEAVVEAQINQFFAVFA